MKLFYARVLLVAFLCGVGVIPSYADNPSQGAYDYTSPAAKVYQSQDANAFGAPSGAINVKVTTTPSAFDAPGTAGTDQTKYYQGCGGVTLGDYTTSLFYNPDTFNKFKRDVNSDLAKQLLTYNYSMPQTAALFDTLNTYGTTRYQQFQNACKLDGLKQDARKVYLSKCMTTDLIAAQRALIVKAFNGVTPQPDATQFDQLAYAQAWDSCTTSATTVTDVKAIADVNAAFAKTVQSSQDVNKTISSLLCTKADGSALTSGCWQTLFLPKVSLCLDSTLDPNAGTTGCGDGKKYGVKDAAVGMTAFFDLIRYVVSEGMVKRVYNDFMTQFKTGKGNNSVLMSIADEAAASMDQLTIVGSTNTDATKAAAPTKADDIVATFENGFLNCNNHNAMTSLDVMAAVLKKRTPAISIAPKTLLQGSSGNGGTAGTDYDIYINATGLNTGDDNDKKALALLTQSAAGCAVTQHIPMFDPHLIARMNKECNNTLDIPAFQMMAGYDVALQGTRDVYQYLLFQLKQVNGRLLTDSMVPRASTTSTDAATVSPELNRKLANAVQEIMIPYVEAQITRLDKLNETRGQFSQRVQKIYVTKKGCVGVGANGGYEP